MLGGKVSVTSNNTNVTDYDFEATLNNSLV